MLEIDRNEWLSNANKAINKELLESFRHQQQDSWSENYITTRLLMALLNIGRDIKWKSMPQRVKWDSFKLKGKRETELGDIAFFMRVMLTADVYLDGVVFYEAKRQFYDKSYRAQGFNSIKLEQLTRIQKVTSASNVLLYDIDTENKTVGAFALPTVFVEKIIDEAPDSVTEHGLIHYGNLWVKSLAENFSGFGLDYSLDAVKKMKEFLNSSEKPLTIINASASMQDAIEPELDNSFIPLDSYENFILPQAPTPKLKNNANKGMS